MQQDYLLNSYDFDLPQDQIAQFPASSRDESRLMVLDRKTDDIVHRKFSDIIDLFQAGDILVINNTRVFPARLHGSKETGGKAEVFLLEYPVITSTSGQQFQTASTPVLIKSSRRPKIDSIITVSEKLKIRVTALHDHGKAEVELHFSRNDDLATLLDESGQVPLPPYIARPQGATDEDRLRYQTVYAKHPGAVAAPTAGLHFTDTILEKLSKKGVKKASILLHVGFGTFAPVHEQEILNHKIHSEHIEISTRDAALINETKRNNGRVWAVGTTTVRALEYGASRVGILEPVKGQCSLYITPGFNFKVVDRMITNFHLPKSSLLFLVSAFYDRKKLLTAYREAIKEKYRFFSYGDSMVIL